MVKIGRAPKNFGLTKVQARKVAKENDGVLQPLAIAEARNNAMNNELTKSLKNSNEDQETDFGEENYENSKLQETVGITQDEKITSEEERAVSNVENERKTLKEEKSKAKKVDCLPKTAEFGIVKSLTVYEDTLEDAIHRATLVLSKWNMVNVKTRYRSEPRKDSNPCLARELQSSVHLLNDFRYIGMTNTLHAVRRHLATNSGAFPLLSTRLIQRPYTCVNTKETWTRLIAESLRRATISLEKKLESFYIDDEKLRAEIHENNLPHTLFTLNLKTLSNRRGSGHHLDTGRSQEDANHLNCLAAERVFCKFPPISINVEDLKRDEGDSSADDESPRERMRRKLRENGYDEHLAAPKSELSAERKSLKEYLAYSLVTLYKKSYTEKYDSMTRAERRNALRHEIVLKFRPRVFLPLLTRHLGEILFSDISAKMFGAHRCETARDILLALLPKHEFKHGILFLGLILAEYLGTDVEALRARQEYYRLWTHISTYVEHLLHDRWKRQTYKYAENFSIGQILEGFQRTLRLVAENLIMKLELLIRSRDDEKTMNEAMKVLESFQEVTKTVIDSYFAIAVSHVNETIVKEVRHPHLFSREESRRHTSQVKLLLIITNLPKLESRLGTLTHHLLRKLTNRSLPEHRFFLPGIEMLLRRVIQHAVREKIESYANLRKGQKKTPLACTVS